MRSRLVLSVLLSEQFLPSRVDVRLDGILSYRFDVSPLADSIAFCLLDDDPIATSSPKTTGTRVEARSSVKRVGTSWASSKTRNSKTGT